MQCQLAKMVISRACKTVYQLPLFCIEPNLDLLLVFVAALDGDVGHLEDAAVAVLQAIPVSLFDHRVVGGDLVSENDDEVVLL